MTTIIIARMLLTRTTAALALGLLAGCGRAESDRNGRSSSADTVGRHSSLQDGRTRDPAAASYALREHALGLTASDVGATPASRASGVLSVLMELGFEGAAATLAVFADGTTSLYYSSGGGIIGAGEHTEVREVAEAFLRRAEASLPSLSPTTATPLPASGRVRFYVRTTKGTLTAEGGVEDLGYGRHHLAPLFHAGDSVITALRRVTGR